MKQTRTETKQEVKQELSQSKLEQLNKMPIIETSISLSKSGEFVIHRTVITDIKPKKYFDELLK